MTNFQKTSYFLLRIGMGLLFFSSGWDKNEWWLMLLRITLILGVFVRIVSIFGFVLMWFYYASAYEFRLINEYVVYALVFLLFVSAGSGKILTLNDWIQTRLHPMWHKWVD